MCSRLLVSSSDLDELEANRLTANRPFAHISRNFSHLTGYSVRKIYSMGSLSKNWLIPY